MLIKQTTKLQCEYEGRVYDSFEELKKAERKRVSNIVAESVQARANILDAKDNEVYMSCSYGMRATNKHRNLLIALQDTDRLLYDIRLMEIESNKLENALREYAWRTSYNA